jgi:hypothetical protein
MTAARFKLSYFLRCGDWPALDEATKIESSHTSNVDPVYFRFVASRTWRKQKLERTSMADYGRTVADKPRPVLKSSSSLPAR